MIRRHALHVLLGLSLLAVGACARSTASLRPQPYPGGPPSVGVPSPPAGSPREAPPPAGAPSGRTIAAAALHERGRPYRFGGTTPAGFDCSGLVQYVFAQYGITLPREVWQQFRVGRRVSARAIQPGDLLFFHTEGRGASHVGIALGHGLFVDAPSTHGYVRVDRIDAPYWQRRFLGARRVLPEPAVSTGFRSPA